MLRAAATGALQIMPLGSLSLLINKDTFGKDEMQVINSNNRLLSNALWLSPHDFSIDSLSIPSKS
jgi:hypothetical protein